jgi:glycosyltransferase involved in cell wall biosynthesis
MTSDISVVIPLYNKGPYIQRALDSVLNQTIQNIEIVVVDDGSTDNGAFLVQKCKDERVKFVEQENAGVSAARNRGVTHSRGNFIAFLDADDEWMPVHLETLLRLRERYPEAGMYSTAYQIADTTGIIGTPKYQAIPPFPWEGILPNFFLSAAGELPVNASVVGIPKAVFLELGGFQQGRWWGEDIDLFGRIALEYPVAFSWTVGAVYHHDAGNRACDKVPELTEQPFVITARKALAKGEVPEEIKQDLVDFVAKLEIYRAYGILKSGNPKAARGIVKPLATVRFRRDKWYVYLLTLFPVRIIRFAWRIKRGFRGTILKKDYSYDPWFKD